MSRFTTFTATYRIVTPMFCGGAGQEAGLRLSSFKGALRFWWRTLQWGKVRDEKELWTKEADLFGSSDQEFGQSKVRIRLVSSEPSPLPRCGNNLGTGLNGAYYLGYGVMNIRGEFERARQPIAGGTFTVELRCGPNSDPDKLEEIKAALILLGTVGGLGSKSRKGYGSLTLTHLNMNNSAIDLSKDPDQRLQQILTPLHDGQPDWSAWSRTSRTITVIGERDALKLLDHLGRELVHYRSWGKEGKVLNQIREENFKDDHDLYKEAQTKGSNFAPSRHPERVSFGLPHNYGNLQVKPIAYKSDGTPDRQVDRRSSPLFFHIHHYAKEDAPVGVLSFLPSRFLPSHSKISTFSKSVDLNIGDSFWKPIHGYLDRLLEEPTATKKKNSNLEAKEVTLG